jgi:hypothetical protein
MIAREGYWGLSAQESMMMRKGYLDMGYGRR